MVLALIRRVSSRPSAGISPPIVGRSLVPYSTSKCKSLSMGLFSRERRQSSVGLPAQGQVETGLGEGAMHERWYVPIDGDTERFKGVDGLAPLHLITYTDALGETVLRLCEDATGLLIGPTDRRLAAAGIYVSQLRGEAYHEAACRAGSFEPGAQVNLVREPENEFDRNAVVVYDSTGAHLAAYVNKQKARTLAKLMDAGRPLKAISLRGAPAGKRCDQIAILAAHPDLVAHLRQPRPSTLPPPAHLG